jgi:hypothetical protein
MADVLVFFSLVAGWRALFSAVNWCRQHRGGRALNAERRTRALLSGHQKRSTAVFYRRAFVARVAWTAETFEQPLPPRREWFFLAEPR